VNPKVLLYSAVLFLTAWSFSRPKEKEKETEQLPVPEAVLPRLDPALYHTAAIEVAKAPDPILAAYKNGEAGQVLAFFAALCGSSELAALILGNAVQYDIAPALAFALCWEESRYYKYAVNQNPNGSVDRGLFQLNSRSFPELSIDDFFNPEINVRYAMTHLKWCLDRGGSELSGLAMYNAGTGRVNKGGTPKITLNYISRVISYRRGIEALFGAEIAGQPDFALR
jgi:soluble lytic murein transglycosylase-like protein